MRPLEIVIPALLAIYLVRPSSLKSILIGEALLIGFHLIIEGWRWQMFPIYLIYGILACLAYFSVDIKPIASFLTFGILALSTAVPALLPVPAIPAPSGNYQIGTASFELTDSSRKEIYSGRDEPRRFLIQVWYPAEVKSGDSKYGWISDPEIYTPAISSFIGMPPFFLDHLALVQTPAYLDAQIADSDKLYPVILFSHGWKGFNAQNTGQALELASRGFVVIAVQHTYGAVTTVFPDGTIAPNNPNALPEDSDAPNYEEVANILAMQWAGDLSFTLDQIQSPESEAGVFFSSHLDLKKIGAYGHSTGGGAAVQFCENDPRCKSVLGMDPFMRPVSIEIIENGIQQPSFFMFSAEWADKTNSKNNKRFNLFYESLQENLGVVSILDTKHYDFSDLPLLSPIAPQLGLKGPLNGKRVVEIVNAYLIGFFEQTLMEQPSRLFTDTKRFEEVKMLK